MDLRAYLLGGVAAAFLALCAALWWQTGRVDDLRGQNAALRASVAAMELERELARDAQAVAEARALAVEARAREYDQLREGILRHGEDADLPGWMLDALGGLRGRDDNETDQPKDPG